MALLTAEENTRDTEEMVAATPRFFVRIALDGDEGAMGFAEATLRTDFVNGCVSSPGVFLEGIYVEPQARRQGVARLLVDVVGAWGESRDVTSLLRTRYWRTQRAMRFIARWGLRRRRE